MMMSREPVTYIKNILSFEVEDTFHADNPDYELDDVKSRIIPILIHLLSILDHQKATATFFVLGWVASRFPEIVSLVDSRGHEVACHGFSHKDISKIGPEKLKSEIDLSKETIENILNKRVLGFKGACDPLDKKHLHILNDIAKAGYAYDCSTRPGIVAGKSFGPFDIEFKDGKSIKIIPQSAMRKFGVWLRFGEKLRLYPSWFTIRAIGQLNRMGYPAMINMKLWELDRDQIRGVNADYIQYRRYGNLNIAEEKLSKILDVFEFTACAEALGIEY
ncbi:MAG: polysaccharide deacetylase family protein [Candidatus Zixiibacteriota bacterium]|nr:MAG: polysaccharide deacetylase family protein [candidate division Zixibacteria bacterium]